MPASGSVGRVMRPLVKVTAALVAVLLIVVTAALVYVTTDAGEQRLAALAKDSVAAAGLGELTIAGLEVGFPISLAASDVTIEQDGHRWLEIRGLRVRLALAALAAGNLRFNLLAADAVEVGRPPGLPESTDEEPSSWPRAVIVDELALERIVVAGELLGLESGSLGPIELRGRGLYRLQAGTFDVDAGVNFTILAGRSAAGQAFSAGPGTVRLDVAGGAGRAKGAASIGVERVGFGDVVVAGAQLDATIEPGPRSAVAVTLSGSADPTKLPEAMAFLFGQRVVLGARAELGGEEFALRRVTADLDPGAGVTVHADAKGSASRFVEHLVGSVALEGRELDWPKPHDEITRLLGRAFTFAADFDLQPGVGIELPKVALRFGPLTADGHAGMLAEDGSVNATVSGSLADLAPLSDVLGRSTSGALEFGVVADGTVDALVLATTLETTSLEVEGTEIDQALADIDVTGLPGGPLAARLSAKLAGTVDQEAAELDLSASVEMQEDGLPKVVAALSDRAGNRLDVGGRFVAGDGLTQGRLVADVVSLAEIGRLIGVEIAGRVAAEMTSDEHGIAGTAEVAALRIAGGVELRTLTARPAPSPDKGIDIEALGVAVGGMQLDRATAALRSSDDGYTAHVVLEDTHGAIDVAADVRVVSDDGGLQATLASLTGTAAGHVLSLQQPLVFERGTDGHTRVTGEITVGEGHARIDWTANATASFGRLHAEKFPLRYITPLIDETLWLDGSVAADVVVLEPGPDVSSEPTVTVTVRGMRAADASGRNAFAGLDLDAKLSQRAREFAFYVELADGVGDRMELTGSVERAPTASLFSGVTSASALSASLEGGLGPTAVSELAVLADARFTGRLTADLRVTGQVADPTLQGLVELAEGRYDDAASGAVVEDIDLRIEAANTDIAAITLTGDDGEDGRMVGRGEVDLSGGILRPRAEATLKLYRMRAARLDEVSAHISGALELLAAPDDVQVSGRVSTDELSLQLPKRLPDDIVELTVVEENSELLDRPAQRNVVEAPGPVAVLDVIVEVPGPAFVRSREVKTEWRGRIEIGGNTDALTIGGGLDLMRGDFAALGVRVVASEGKLRFDPSADARHTIDLRGHIRRGTVDVTVIISGALDDLSVRLESEPPMPEDEILAFVLFGSSVASLTAVQAVQLAAAVASLANPRNAADPLAWVRETTGLDRVGIVEKEFEEESQYMLSAGKYVRDGVFVSVEQPLGDGASEVAVELEVTERLRLKSSVGADSTGSVGAAWTLDY